MTRLSRLSLVHVVPKLMGLIGILVLVPLLVIIWYPQDAHQAWTFIVPGLGSIILAYVVDGLWRLRQRHQSAPPLDNPLLPQTIVVFAWLYGIVIGALPFMLDRSLRPVQALFEAVSGWTTTGLSVMDVSTVSHVMLFHRSFMQFCGGLGFVLMMMLIVTDKSSGSLFVAEGHPDKLMPSIKKTAQAIGAMYSTCLLAGSAAYIVAGMSVFDAINHAMAALSTGGFSTRAASIGYYHSLPIEIITLILMIIGTTNFAVLLLASKGQWRQVAKVSEMRLMVLLLVVFTPLTAWFIMDPLHIGFWHALRLASMDVVSAMSTTGFSSMAYTNWSPVAIGCLIIVMIIGGGIGSTAGGLKIARAYLLLRLAWSYTLQRLAPSRRVTAPTYTKAQGVTLLDAKVSQDVTGFFIVYMLVFCLGGMLVTATSGAPLSHGFFEFASSLSTVGLSIGITNPDTNNATLIVEMVGMFMGRLELFIVVMGGMGLWREMTMAGKAQGRMRAYK